MEMYELDGEHREGKRGRAPRIRTHANSAWEALIQTQRGRWTVLLQARCENRDCGLIVGGTTPAQTETHLQELAARGS